METETQNNPLLTLENIFEALDEIEERGDGVEEHGDSEASAWEQEGDQRDDLGVAEAVSALAL